MKIFKKLALGLTLVLGFTIGFTGCSQNNKSENKLAEKQEDTKKVIGFVPMTLNNEYFVMMANAAKSEAATNGVSIQVQAGSEHSSAEEQLKIIETMIENKVSAICVVPSSSEGLSVAVKRAQEAGIPIVNIDTRFDKTLFDKENIKPIPFIGTDNYEGGKIAGKEALKLFPKGAKTVILNGIEGQQNASDRRNGFYSEVENKGFKIVAEQTANWDVEKAYKATQNILQSNKDLDLIFAANDTMALGALRALEEANKKDVAVIGFDGNTEALNSVLNNGLKATVAQDPVKMGIEGVKTAIKLIEGQSTEQSLNTGANIVNKENAPKYIEYFEKYSK